MFFFRKIEQPLTQIRTHCPALAALAALAARLPPPEPITHVCESRSLDLDTKTFAFGAFLLDTISIAVPDFGIGSQGWLVSFSKMHHTGTQVFKATADTFLSPKICQLKSLGG